MMAGWLRLLEPVAEREAGNHILIDFMFIDLILHLFLSETMDKLRAADEQCRVSAEISRQAAEIGHKVIFEGVEHTSSLMESEIASKRFRGEGNSDCGGNSYCLSLGKVPTLLVGSLSNKRCEEPNCFKFPQGSTRFCISHGGGRRCTYKDCSKGARDRFFCATHGGGRRCVADFCSKSAVGGSQLCASHGGGRKCTFDGCGKSAQSPTPFCVMHGGGKKCQMVGCTKVSRGKTQFCASHGGGVRCATLNCGRAAISKHKFCRAHLTEDSSAENF